MAYRVPPVLPVPERLRPAITAAVRWKALQHQDELTALLTWISQLDPPLDLRVIVEIGTHQGGTLACWAELATDLVVGIDLPLGGGGPSQWGGLTPDATAIRNTTFERMYPHVRNLLGNSQSLATRDRLQALLAGRPIDLLFIDGDHTLGGVSTDYVLYSPLVRRGGVIAFHDANPTVRNQHQDLAVPAFFATLPAPRFFFSVGADWGGIGAVVV